MHFTILFARKARDCGIGYSRSELRKSRFSPAWLILYPFGLPFLCNQSPFFCIQIIIQYFVGYYRSCKLAAEIRRILDPREGQCRICVVCPKGVSFVIAQWAVWMSGHIMVPVLSTHSPKATQYFVSNR